MSDREEVALGFMFDHSMLSDLSRRVLAAGASAAALAELLVESGIVAEDALDKRYKAMERHLAGTMAEAGLGLFVNDNEEDKYQVEPATGIDCAARMPLCRAACCRLRFPLSRQDVEEQLVEWDFGRPYWNRVDSSGYCVHNDAETGRCTVYDARPTPCRSYDCRNDRRIWSDYEGRVPSPELADWSDGGRAFLGMPVMPVGQQGTHE